MIFGILTCFSETAFHERVFRKQFFGNVFFGNSFSRRHLFIFLSDEEHGSSTSEEQDARDEEHPHLRARAYIFKEYATAESSHNLREADGAVEESEIVAHVVTLE